MWAVNGDLREHRELERILLPPFRKNINDRTIEGYSLLMLAAKKGREDMVKALLGMQDIDINATDNHQESALMMTVKENRVRLVELLLTREEIDVNQADWQGNTALMKAVSSGNEQIVRLLLKNSEIQISLRNCEGKSAFDLNDKPELKALLVIDLKSEPEEGVQRDLPNNLHGLVASLTKENEEDVLFAIRKLVLIDGQDVDALKEYDLMGGRTVKRTALHCAVLQNCTPASNVLLQLGANREKIECDLRLSQDPQARANLSRKKVWSEEQKETWREKFRTQRLKERRAAYGAAFEKASTLIEAIRLQNVKLVQKFLEREEPTQEILSYALSKAAHAPKDLDERLKRRYLANTADILFELVAKNPELLMFTGPDGRTPLFEAVGLRSIDIVEQLLNLVTVGPEYFHKEDKSGHSVISYAALIGCHDIAAMLQKRCDQLNQTGNRIPVQPAGQESERHKSIKNEILSETDEKHVVELITALRHSLQNGAFLPSALLWGPARNKTLVAERIARSNDMEFRLLSPSAIHSEIRSTMSKEEGKVALNAILNATFASAKLSHRPCIIVIDECETVLGKVNPISEWLLSILTWLGTENRNICVFGISDNPELLNEKFTSYCDHLVYIGAPAVPGVRENRYIIDVDRNDNVHVIDPDDFPRRLYLGREANPACYRKKSDDC